ncbi:CsgE family curli-type amyloid fiber assembly protein [Mesonia maritima]|uniref:Curli production assembly/transport component CsgE n=1 Tax=Mesonia maritima TaxID=1793873 RepID=A0ABU1K4S5_9FLAO|nr:CsgE family curli-type amyloid fiber assembly protein [Mesonia maritima]MDR6300603.1 hypothetical protein [Mesonia maritima]
MRIINSYKNFQTLLLIIFLLPVSAMAQYYNKDVEGKLKIENNDDYLNVVGVASNKTDVNQSLRYELSVIKTSNGGNHSKNAQSGRFTLEPNGFKELSQTTINLDSDNKVIVLLLIYDLEDNLLGKDRYVINGEDEEEPSDEDIKSYDNEEEEEKPDGIVLRGIVTQDTKTKAGNDFFNYFYSAYRNNSINSEKIIDIQEQFNLGRSTKIQIKVDNELVFQFFAQPKDEYLKSMVDVSIRRVSRYLEQLKRDAETIKKY